MLPHFIKIISITTFIALSGNVYTQQNIPISDSLAANAEILELTKGYISGNKIKKFHFSDYSMHTYKRMPTKTKNKENFFVKMHSNESLYTSSFMLSNITHDTAQVLMSHQVQEKYRENWMTGIVQIGEKHLMSSDFFTAWITINRDTSDKWTLFVGTSFGKEVESMQASYLSNGARTINLNHVRVREKGTNILGLPAMGYEFIEDGKSLGAIQMFNGQLSQTSCTVWIDNRLDTKTKLLLATAMTALEYEPDELSE